MKDIDCCINITIMMSMTNRTFPITNRQIFRLFVDIPTDITSLRGGEVSVYLHNLFAVPFRLIGEHGNETAPTCISYRFSKVMISLHSLNIQVFDTYSIIFSHKRNGTLMQIVCTAVGNLFVNSGNFESLVFKPSTAFLLARKILLCPCKFALVFPCISIVLESFSFGSDKQVLQPHIRTNRLISLFKWCCVFFFCKYRNEILSTRRFGDSNLPDFSLYFPVYAALDAFFELGYEESVISDRSKLRDGKAILRMLGFKVREFCTLLKEIGIGYFETTDSKLQGLGIYFFKPCGFFLLLKFGKILGLCVIIIAFTSKPILLFALIEKVIIHKPSATEMPCQQIGLCLVRVQSELVCSINLSHIATKDKHYFLNYQKFMYICDMLSQYFWE